MFLHRVHANDQTQLGSGSGAILVEIGAIGGLIAVLLALAALSVQSVEVTVDGLSESVVTHRRSVDRLLLDLGLDKSEATFTVPLLSPATASAAPSTGGIATQSGRAIPQSLGIERGRPYRVSVDGREISVTSRGTTVGEVLTDAGVSYFAADRVTVKGKTVAMDTSVPALTVSDVVEHVRRPYPWDKVQRQPLQLRLERSRPITIEDDGLAVSMRTTAPTVGEALRDAKVTLYLGDRVQPSLGSAITPGTRITVQRSMAVSVEADGTLLKTRSRAETVADLLAELKIGLSGLDVVEPPLETALHDNVAIEVSRVSEEIAIEEEIAPFETIFEPDPSLPIDSQRVLTPGAEGITRTRYRIRYEEDEIVDNKLEDRWVAQDPAQRTIAYGTRIEPKTFTADDGQEFTYWRKVRMRASSYSAGTAGLDPSHPWYGRTYTGEAMRGGIVAVDPSIVPLRSQVYVPGYGIGDALDTGSAVRARRIDLGYDDSSLKLWSSWVDVYLLWPPPPEYEITWVVPNWPRLPQ